MSDSRTVPTTGSVLVTLAGVTWRRLFRGRALWVSALIALLPVLLAGILTGRHAALQAVDLVLTLVMILIPPMFVASSVGEEIEDRTTTYLWSRPIARWTILVGKLLALAPVALVLVVASAILASKVAGVHRADLWFINGRMGIVAIAAGTIAISAIAAGLAVLVPKHGMALSIIYLVIVDLFIGALPASIGNISITHQVRELAGGESPASPAIAMASIAGVWLAIALWRIRRMES